MKDKTIRSIFVDELANVISDFIVSQQGKHGYPAYKEHLTFITFMKFIEEKQQTP